MRRLLGTRARLAVPAVGVLVVCFSRVPTAEAGWIRAWGVWGQEYAPAGDDFIAVAGGGGHSLALRTDGSIVEWGATEGRPPSSPGWVAVDGGSRFSVALHNSGGLLAWGRKRGFVADWLQDSRGFAHFIAWGGLLCHCGEGTAYGEFMRDVATARLNSMQRSPRRGRLCCGEKRSQRPRRT